MRPARMLLGAALALALAWPVRGGEAVLFQARVQTDAAEVRCKPGTEPAVYVTQKLARGEVVEVVKRTNDGWLEIVPPKGSYSWVNIRQLRRFSDDQRVWMVTADGGPVPALVGTPFKPGKPDVVGTRLERGAQVVAVGEPWPSEDGDGLWLPVMPPPGEYRYVREKDVVAVPASPGPAATTTVAHPGSAGFPDPGAGQRPASGGPSQELPPPSQDVRVGGPANVDPLLQRAEQLERAGDRAGAAGLYDQLGRKYVNSNHDAAMQYDNRAAWLRQGQPAAPRPVTEADALYQQAVQYDQAGNWAEASRAYARLGDMVQGRDYSLAMQYYNRAAWLRQRQPAAPAAPAAKPPVAAGPATSQQSGVVQAGGVVSGLTGETGRLMRSATWIDGRATYVLESPQAQVKAYLVPQPGVDLEPSVGRNVEVFGQVASRADVRGRFMTVAKVLPMSAP